MIEKQNTKKFAEKISTARKTYGKRSPGAEKNCLSQGKLYKMCVEYETDQISRGELRERVFMPYSEQVGARRIKEFERGERFPSPRQIEIFAAVLGLKVSDFDDTNDSDCEKANPLARHDEKCSIPQKVIGLYKGMHRIRQAGVVAKTINEIASCFSSNNKGVSVVVIKGPPGYGKSHIISSWWVATGREKHRDCALYIDCTRLPGDKIVREIGTYFGCDAENFSSTLTRSIQCTKRAIIILDGLSTEAPEITMTPTGADAVTMKRVVEYINIAAKNKLGIDFLLGVQTDNAISGRLTFDTSIQCRFVELGKLDDHEGALMLKDLGVTGVSDADLCRISSHLMGWPMALEAAAKALIEEGENGCLFAQEELITGSGTDEKMYHSFDLFVSNFMKILDSSNASSAAHPHAFLRLLSLFSGPVHESILRSCVNALQLRRISKSGIEALLVRNTPFVTKYDNMYYLHPYIKKCILAQLAKICSGVESDINTDRHEIILIHMFASCFYIGRLQPEQQTISIADINFVEGALHHLLSLCDYEEIDIELSECPLGVKLRDAINGLDKRSIFSFCYESLVRQYLFDKRNQLTRFLGHYETKARLLGFLGRRYNSVRSQALFSRLEWCRIFTETGICWMHSGRLELANIAISNAMQNVDYFGQDNSKVIKAIFDPDDGEAREIWIHYAQLSSIRALIMLRQGREKSLIDDSLSYALKLANEIILMACNIDLHHLRSMFGGTIRAAKNIVTRNAHVKYLSGDIHGALADYCDASNIERMLSGNCLSGDAVRRHVEVLIRSRDYNEFDIVTAKLLVEDNFRLKFSEQKALHRLSNDIIGLLTLRAMLFRISGDYISAKMSIDDAFSHRYVSSGEAPYNAIQELKIESLRLRSVTNDGMDSLQHEISTLVSELDARHHQLLSLQARLLLVEVSSNDMNDEIDYIEMIAGLLGWSLLRDDARKLREASHVRSSF